MSGDDNNNEENEEEEEDEEEESHHGYMERSPNGSDDESARSGSSISSNDVKIDRTCSIKDIQAPTEAPRPPSSYFQNSLDKYEKAIKVTLKSKNIHPPESRMRAKVEPKNDQGKNVNLWSVTLKSMQHKGDETDESRELLLPLLLKEQHDDALASNSQTESELPTNCLLQRDSRVPESQNGPEEEQTDISRTDVCDRTPTGCMATLTHQIETENDSSSSSEEEEDENTSGYMTR